ncbi:MAG: signal peptidase I [Symploca sp. SIO2G7]|nr:signal peptidase I [Symploca sp. SIO2G7]
MVSNESSELANSTTEEKEQEKSTAGKQEQKPTSDGSSFWRQVLDNVQIIAIALALALLIRAFVAEPRYIPSDSMLPTLEAGDRVVVEKISYLFRPPAPGEIIVFNPPLQLQIRGYDSDQAFIKRVVGTPGKTIAVQGGKVYLNNTPLAEDYIAEPPKYQMGLVNVPNEQFFVMGDNRNNSNDSHVWGFLPKQNVIGRACFRFWPLSRIGSI